MSHAFIINDRSMTSQYQLPEVLVMRYQHRDDSGPKKTTTENQWKIAETIYTNFQKGHMLTVPTMPCNFQMFFTDK